MIIDGKHVSHMILEYLKNDVSRYRKKVSSVPKLVVFSVRPKEQDLSFIKSKEKAAEKIGAHFQHVSHRRLPRFQDFAQKLRSVAADPLTTGIVIQKPLPSALSTITLFDYISTEKEIEGHKKKSPFTAPIGLAVLTCIKYAFDPGKKDIATNVMVNLDTDIAFLKNLFKRKRIVLLGRGETGGKPVGDMLSSLKINFININSKTPEPESFISAADVIISAVGKPVITRDMIKPGSLLISVGLQKQQGVWSGDYNENEIKDIVGAYTPTPGGVGPIDIAYLMFNLVKAWKIQNENGVQ